MKKLEINSNSSNKSKIIIEKGLIEKICAKFHNYFLITNTTLYKLYPDIVNSFDVNRIIVIKDGEKYKNFKTVNFIIEKLLQQKIERSDTIVALGGGVVGDIAGYCASIILRGVNLIQIPTTLLAMCDSSIGGKTGYNTNHGKNLIGSFYLASKVLIDTSFLKTLNKKEYSCGMGEIIKYATIEKSCRLNKFYNLLDFLIKNDNEEIKNRIDDIIKVCVHLKTNIVNNDFKEGHLRKILNFGHTYAHPIETLGNYKKFSHGAAVALGIKYATKLSYNLDIIDKEYFDKILYLLNKFKFNTKHNYNPAKIIELMFQDKKVKNSKINLLLPIGFGQVGLFDNIDLPSIEASLL